MAVKQLRCSQREYARRLGVSNTAVQKAIQEKKIVKGYDKLTKQIIVPIADVEWGRLHIKFDVNEAFENAGHDSGPAAKRNQLGLDTPFGEAKRLGEIFSAQLKGIAVKTATKELVRADEVRDQLTAFGQIIRSNIISVPDRIVDNVLACKSRQEAHALMTNALYEALEALTQNNNEFEFSKR